MFLRMDYCQEILFGEEDHSTTPTYQKFVEPLAESPNCKEAIWNYKISMVAGIAILLDKSGQVL